jgi:hypothetical protein
VTGVEGVPPPPPRGFPVISLWIFSFDERMSLHACMHRHRLKPPTHIQRSMGSRRGQTVLHSYSGVRALGGGGAGGCCGCANTAERNDTLHHPSHAHTTLPCLHYSVCFGEGGQAGGERAGWVGWGAGCVAAGSLRDPARHIAGQR